MDKKISITIEQKLYFVAGLLIIALLLLGTAFTYTNYAAGNIAQNDAHFQTLKHQLDRLESDVLTLQILEKDFLLAPSEQIIQTHHEAAEKIKEDLTALDQSIHDKDEQAAKAQVSAQLTRYLRTFNEVVQLHQKIGFSHNTGLHGTLRQAVHQAEKTLKTHNQLELSHSMLLLRRHEKDFMARINEKYTQRFNKEYQHFLRLLKASELPATAQTSVQQVMQHYQAQFNQVVTLTMDIQQQRQQLNHTLNGITPKLDALLSRAKTLHTQNQEQHATATSNIQWAYYTILGAIALLLIPTILFLNHSIHRSISCVLNLLRDTANKEADFTRRLSVNSQDEMQVLAEYFNIFMEKLQKMLTDIDHLACQLNTISTQAEGTNQQTQAAIQSQFQQINEIAQGVAALSQSISNIAHNTHTTAEKSDTALQDAISSHAHIKTLMASSHALSIDIALASEQVETLYDKANHISRILNVISKISEQTNLLAVNASIEAARTDQHGRGFAVVANEVRSLSQRTTESTQTIHSIIQQLQLSTHEVLHSMNASKQDAQNSSDIAQVAGDSMTHITQAIETTATINHEIADVVTEQSSKADQLNQDFHTVHDATQRLSEAATNMLEGRSKLAESATELRQVTHCFKGAA